MNSSFPILIILLSLATLHDQLAWCATSPSFSRTLASIERNPLHHTQLNFDQFIKRQLRSDINQIEKQLSRLHQDLRLTRPPSPNLCEKLMLNQAEQTLAISSERLDLLKKGIQAFDDNTITLRNSKKWYLHWLKSWLRHPVTISTLEQIAVDEIKNAKQRKFVLEKASLPSQTSVIEGGQHSRIVNAFRQREKQILAHIPAILGSSYQPGKVRIAKSNYGINFPAPGVYQTTTKTFFYHLQSDHLPVKQMDWLFIHEAVPGHHFFGEYANNVALCREFGRARGSTLFTEGWAAYTEELGTDLGLYSDIDSAMYALDWQEMRAVRVLIDIGIHFKKWSDEKAQSVWLQYLPHQHSIMNREIARIKKWPVQVITYVYGKAKVQSFIASQQYEFPQKTLPEIHKNILDLSNFSLEVLAYYHANTSITQVRH